MFQSFENSPSTRLKKKTGNTDTNSPAKDDSYFFADVKAVDLG